MVWHQAQGYQDVSTEKALKPNSIFYIQSMTKPIMSVVIMQLVERGVINLNDPIEIYIPEAKHLRVAIDPNLGLDSPTQKSIDQLQYATCLPIPQDCLMDWEYEARSTTVRSAVRRNLKLSPSQYS